MLTKYIKSVLWRVAKCLSYIEEARCLKVNPNLQHLACYPHLALTAEVPQFCASELSLPLYWLQNVTPLSSGVERCRSAPRCTCLLSGICWHSSCPSPSCHSTLPTIWASQLGDFTPQTEIAKRLWPTATVTSTPPSGRLSFWIFCSR